MATARRALRLTWLHTEYTSTSSACTPCSEQTAEMIAGQAPGMPSVKKR
eukprot:CAMPEP_0169444810 /NCGR_PEP_ID=MMETSP1042-20121227/10101_1 /TAXON_ID=464988 /ORGANISM="Hemiselmis andersenii, Strain CCMP1180" /LENGTH=48 /DNA_ID= /DNA_START= /DNA_END= /DNA_ORIENTATION=